MSDIYVRQISKTKMAVRDTGTEQLIKDTAKRVFFAEGKLQATTQDIADAAGVARTVINYYFRSKDILFELVFKEAMADTRKKLDEVITASLPLKEKVTRLIDVFSADVEEFPYKESFLISEINRHGFVAPEKEHSIVLEQFLKEIQQGIDSGEVKKMLPINFMINLFSLLVYPFITRQLFKQILEVTDIKFEHLMNDRKKMIIDLLFV